MGKSGQRINPEEFRDKFAIDEWNGNFKLTSWGCFQRHNKSRMEQNTTRTEDYNATVFSGSRGAMRSERRLLGRVAFLLSRGYRLRKDHQSLEEFCDEYQDIM